MAGQPTVSESIEIVAPASRIFDILANPRRHVEIDGSHMLQSCLDGPARLGLGSEFVMSMRLGSVPYRVRNRVVEFDEGRLIAWRHFEPQHWRFELVPTESGTRVTETFDYSYWPLAGRLLLVVMGWPRRNKLAIAKTLPLLARTAQISTTETNG
jgi:Polyketide cyclase / dehydrase and lipid transport